MDEKMFFIYINNPLNSNKTQVGLIITITKMVTMTMMMTGMMMLMRWKRRRSSRSKRGRRRMGKSRRKSFQGLLEKPIALL